MKVSSMFEAEFPQMNLEILAGLMMFSMLRNTDRYIFIMQHHQGLIGPKFILKQHNDPKHTARVTKNCLQQYEEQEVLEMMASTEP